MDRVEPTAEYTGFGDVDLVVEAVFEELELKHRVVREIERVIPADAVLGTNTSTLPIGQIAEAAEHPERVIGLHFFSPVDRMPLLEIIAAEGTSPQTVATSHRWGKRSWQDALSWWVTAPVST